MTFLFSNGFDFILVFYFYFLYLLSLFMTGIFSSCCCCCCYNVLHRDADGSLPIAQENADGLSLVQVLSSNHDCCEFTSVPSV